MIFIVFPKSARDCSIKRGKRYTIYRARAAFGAVYTGATDAVFKSPAQKKE
ncbi:ACT domain protein [Pseudomonas amygdali pv. myricae]|nr:ACT domain protein [Pseudomonas amygdali pv. myricae]RMV26557.1 ACT domain protein [Pseudomonas amygdali pv. myricae]